MLCFSEIHPVVIINQILFYFTCTWDLIRLQLLPIAKSAMTNKMRYPILPTKIYVAQMMFDHFSDCEWGK